MITLRQAALDPIACARANRKYSLAFTVILLVLIALLHPGTRNLRKYSKEVSDAIAHAVDSPAEPKKAPEWHALHEKYTKELAAAKDVDLLMYGDSIFESLLGNQFGQANAVWADVAKVWTKYHGSSKSMVLAISGDTTVQLLWRLQHGELPATTDIKQAVILIGTNDLTAYHQHQLTDADETASAVSAGVIAVCEQLIDHSPRMKIVLMALLPRGAKEVEAPAVKALLPNKRLYRHPGPFKGMPFFYPP
ncbi:platelet-activating factor acetyltransferase activity protein [Trebouxia sp. C0010 RCD-2024]